MTLRDAASFARTVLVSTTILFLTGAGAHQEPVAVDKTIPAISQRINAFTIDFLKHVVAEDNGNLILSPQSIYHGVAMSYVASGGKTRAELATAIGYPDDDGQLMTDLARLRKGFLSTADKKTEVNMANSAWLDNTYAQFRKDYLSNLEKVFGASMFRVKYKDKREVSARINRWVAEQTKGRITKVVSPDDFPSRSFPGVIDEPALTTINVVYFKSEWGSRFEKGASEERPFYLDKTRTGNVMMMHQRSLLNYAENDDLQFLELPYIDSKYSMYVLLPKRVLPPRGILALVTNHTCVELMQTAFRREVDVLLPKFEMRYHCSVKNVLRGMGAADKMYFDRMIIRSGDATRVYLSEIYHDAWVAVDEKGTEAAAATTAIHYSIGCSAVVREPPEVFHADHPFLFFIVHNKSKSILFAGVVANPNALAGGSQSK